MPYVEIIKAWWQGEGELWPNVYRGHVDYDDKDVGIASIDGFQSVWE